MSNTQPKGAPSNCVYNVTDKEIQCLIGTRQQYVQLTLWLSQSHGFPSLPWRCDRDICQGIHRCTEQRALTKMCQSMASMRHTDGLLCVQLSQDLAKSAAVTSIASLPVAVMPLDTISRL